MCCTVFRNPAQYLGMHTIKEGTLNAVNTVVLCTVSKKGRWNHSQQLRSRSQTWKCRWLTATARFQQRLFRILQLRLLQPVRTLGLQSPCCGRQWSSTGAIGPLVKKRLRRAYPRLLKEAVGGRLHDKGYETGILCEVIPLLMFLRTWLYAIKHQTRIMFVYHVQSSQQPKEPSEGYLQKPRFHESTKGEFSIKINPSVCFLRNGIDARVA